MVGQGTWLDRIKFNLQFLGELNSVILIFLSLQSFPLDLNVLIQLASENSCLFFKA